MRGNTAEMRAATLSDVATRTQAIPMAMATDPQFADFYRRVMTGDELDPSETMQATGILVTGLKLAEESFIAYEEGRMDEAIWQTRASFALGQFRGGGSSRAIWELIRERGNFVPEFVDWFDAALVERYGE